MLGIRKNVVTENLAKHLTGLPREAVESPSPEGFKSCGVVALRDVV